jgi:VIT1/CCC1 family predicted Fe2+/Mn2+ transporter
LPYVFSGTSSHLFEASTCLSLVVLFVVGAMRSRVGAGSWISNGLEMLVLGVIVGAVAYFGGAVVSGLLENR